MQYECEHTCARITSHLACKDTCTVHSNNTSILCLANAALTSSQTIQYQDDCKQEEGTLQDSKETVVTVAIVVTVVVVAALVILSIVIYLKRRCMKRKAGKNDQVETELQDMPNPPEENNSTEAETRAPILTESEKETSGSLTSDQLTNLLSHPEPKSQYRSDYNEI